MRILFVFMLLMIFPFCAATVFGQATPLPPGTSIADDASSSSSQAVSPDSGSARAAALLTGAENEILHSDYENAVSKLNAAIALAPQSSPLIARALYDRGYIEQDQQALAAAEEDFRKAIAADAGQFEAHAALGNLLAAQEQWPEARHQLELATTLHPASGDRDQLMANVERTLARVDEQQHDTTAAGSALLAALKLSPEQPDDTLLAAQLAEAQNNATGAEQQYRQLLTTDPKSLAATEGLARVLIHQQKFSQAEAALAPTLQLEPNDPVLLAQSSAALAGQGRSAEAITQLELLHRQNPNQPAVTRMLADLYSTSGQAIAAQPLYQELLSSDSQNPDLLTASGENQLRLQKWSSAVETFQQSLNLQPDQADAWSDLAFAAAQDQQFPLVLTALDRRLQYLPDGPATLFLRATALDHLHRIKEAIPCYRKFLADSQGKFPDEESQTRQRLHELGKSWGATNPGTWKNSLQ